MDKITLLLNALDESRDVLTTNHVRHARIRLERSLVIQRPTAAAPLLDRVRQHVQQLEQALTDAAATNDKHQSTVLTHLASLAHRTLVQLDTHPPEHTRVHQTESHQLKLGRADDDDDDDTPLPHKAPWSDNDHHQQYEQDVNHVIDRALKDDDKTRPRPPPSLVDSQTWSRAYTLHLLATKPNLVLQPGETLHSLVNRALVVNNSQPPHSIAVFTDPFKLSQLVQTLIDSNVEESTTAWSQLRQLVSKLTLPLVPVQLDKRQTKPHIQSILSQPQLFKLEDATSTLLQLVKVLSRLCSPARDDQVKQITTLLNSTNHTNQRFQSSVEMLFNLLENMHNDLIAFRTNVQSSNFNMLSDHELKLVFVRQAMMREKELVYQVLSSLSNDVDNTNNNNDDDFKNEFHQQNQIWIRSCLDLKHEQSWILSNDQKKMTRSKLLVEALITTLFKNVSVSLPCNVSTSLKQTLIDDDNNQDLKLNVLPPFCYLLSPRLFELQQRIQALIVVACLEALFGSKVLNQSLEIKSSSTSTTTSINKDDTNKMTLSDKLFTILNSVTFNFDDSIKINHIVDEIYQGIQFMKSTHIQNQLKQEQNHHQIEMISKEEMFKKINRVLNYDDLVFKLLKQRLKNSFQEGCLIQQNQNLNSMMMNELHHQMKTGQQRITNVKNQMKDELVVTEPIKGFESVQKQINQTMVEFLSIVDWIKLVWSKELFDQ
ncbi:hypothetical protein OIO90_003148 [Microbotryomycetes sp. JL221]|nr:hypothetical protein OIO90_003148 [Microbotryomycetes sp. JL221]